MIRHCCKLVELVVAFSMIAALGACNKWDDYKANRLVGAVISGKLAEVKKLDAAGYDLNAQDPSHFGWTPLIASIYSEHTNISFYLIDRGVDISKRDSSGDTALMQAIHEDDQATARKLVQARREELKKSEDWRMVRSSIVAAARDNEKKLDEWYDILDGLLE